MEDWCEMRRCRWRILNNINVYSITRYLYQVESIFREIFPLVEVRYTHTLRGKTKDNCVSRFKVLHFREIVEIRCKWLVVNKLNKEIMNPDIRRTSLEPVAKNICFPVKTRSYHQRYIQKTNAWLVIINAFSTINIVRLACVNLRHKYLKV